MPHSKLAMCMTIPKPTLGRTLRRALLLTAFLATLLGGVRVSLAVTFPVRVRIDELAKSSEVIVIAKVETVRGIPVFGKRWARAKVTEVWKGPPMDTIEFLASPTYACDVANAKKGEIVLLFLIKEEGSGWTIDYSGRGRMPLRTVDEKEYATYYDVIFPKETPRTHDPDEKQEFHSAVELAAVRKLVKNAIDEKK